MDGAADIDHDEDPLRPVWPRVLGHRSLLEHSEQIAEYARGSQDVPPSYSRSSPAAIGGELRGPR